MCRHAYLIMVHNEMYLLKQLLETLDSAKNDIYIHLDKKCKNVDLNDLKTHVKKSQVYFVKRMNVTWGGDSMVKCEYRLLKEAFARHYQHYHLLSGVDFPLKSQEYIHNFFEKHREISYIHVAKRDQHHFDTLRTRNKEYHFLQNLIGRYDNTSNVIYRLERKLIRFQRKLGINRLEKCPIKMYKGSQWFSITHDMVREILEKEKIVKKYFMKSYCPDELFINTVIMNSKNNHMVVNDYLRLIDWDRGRPYVFELKDYDELICSNKLFARKFTCETEDGKELISKLKNYVMQE